MKPFVGIAFGTAVGVLLYTRFFSANHQFDRERAVFVGFFVGLIRVAFVAASPTKTQEQ